MTITPLTDSTSGMSGMHATLARVREIQGMADPSMRNGAMNPNGTTAASAFAQQLAAVQNPVPSALATSPVTDALHPANPAQTPGVTAPNGPVGVAPTAADGSIGQKIAQIATAELGVREEPKGSNDGARIAEYRKATKGAGVGPWCSYFTSWVAAQAGVPVGPGGRGEGWVPNVERWGKDTGKWIPSGGTPAVGDLIVFDRNGDGLTDHIGVVTAVRPDGGVETVEGNSSDAVSRRSYDAGKWTGLVRLG